MKFIKVCKSKKVISVILGIMIAFTMFVSSHGQTKNTNEISMSAGVSTRATSNKPNKVISRKTKNNMMRSSYKSYKVSKKMSVSATAYYGDPLTYVGTVPQVGVTIAVDPNVIPLGTRVYIPEFNKVFIAEDTGSAIKGNKIDIFMNTYSECMNWGIRNLTIYILEND